MNLLLASNKRTLMIVVVALVLAVAACDTGTTGTTTGGGSSTTGTVTVVNNSSRTICFLYTTPSTADNYGFNRLAEGDSLDPGESFTLVDVPAGGNDFLAEECGEGDPPDIEEQRALNVPAGQTITWSVDGQIDNP